MEPILRFVRRRILARAAVQIGSVAMLCAEYVFLTNFVTSMFYGRLIPFDANYVLTLVKVMPLIYVIVTCVGLLMNLVRFLDRWPRCLREIVLVYPGALVYRSAMTPDDLDDACERFVRGGCVRTTILKQPIVAFNRASDAAMFLMIDDGAAPLEASHPIFG